MPRCRAALRARGRLTQLPCSSKDRPRVQHGKTKLNLCEGGGCVWAKPLQKPTSSNHQPRNWTSVVFCNYCIGCIICGFQKKDFPHSHLAQFVPQRENASSILAPSCWSSGDSDTSLHSDLHSAEHLAKPNFFR